MYRLLTKILFIQFGVFFLVFVGNVYAGTLSCTVRDNACSGGEVNIFKMQAATNSHAGTTASSYTKLVCCSGVTGLGIDCSGTYATVLELSATTNAHAQASGGAYTTNVCLSVPGGSTVSAGYQSTNCDGYDTTLASAPANDNSHLGTSAIYSTYKICATAEEPSPYLTFSISDTTVGFGTLYTAKARYATGDGAGSDGALQYSHSFTVATNATNGYVVTVEGTTLTCDSCDGATISAIGAVARASSPGTEQFGMRLSPVGGGTVAPPYNSPANWALDTAAFPDQVASGLGDDSSTQFKVWYIANISGLTDAGSYTADLTYRATASF